MTIPYRLSFLLFLLVLVSSGGTPLKGKRVLKRKKHSHSTKSEQGGSGSTSSGQRYGNGSGDDDDYGTGGLEITLKITNLTYLQPFGGFLVVLHNRDADSLFVLGQQASPELTKLAEEGNTGPIKVPYDRSFPYLTLASMAVNTNDCFVALNGVYLSPGQIIEVPGYDAGTEVNNELCSSIPGPACPSGSGNVRSGNGEGYVHIHRGFKGVGDRLSEAGYDWRNPMMLVEVYM